MTDFLENLGYTIFHIDHKLAGLEVESFASKGENIQIYSYINCLATADPDRALKRLGPKGWKILSVPSFLGSVITAISRFAGKT